MTFIHIDDARAACRLCLFFGFCFLSSIARVALFYASLPAPKPNRDAASQTFNLSYATFFLSLSLSLLPFDMPLDINFLCLLICFLSFFTLYFNFLPIEKRYGASTSWCDCGWLHNIIRWHNKCKIWYMHAQPSTPPPPLTGNNMMYVSIHTHIVRRRLVFDSKCITALFAIRYFFFFILFCASRFGLWEQKSRDNRKARKKKTVPFIRNLNWWLCVEGSGSAECVFWRAVRCRWESRR